MASFVPPGTLMLKWNKHAETFLQCLTSYRANSTFTDAIIACDGKLYPVHTLVLSICSEYFEEILSTITDKHPVIVLKDIDGDVLEALLIYMYSGKVGIEQDKLAKFISAAECLMVKGLGLCERSSDDTIKHSPTRSQKSKAAKRKLPPGEGIPNKQQKTSPSKQANKINKQQQPSTNNYEIQNSVSKSTISGVEPDILIKEEPVTLLTVEEDEPSPCEDGSYEQTEAAKWTDADSSSSTPAVTNPQSSPSEKPDKANVDEIDTTKTDDSVNDPQQNSQSSVMSNSILGSSLSAFSNNTDYEAIDALQVNAIIFTKLEAALANASKTETDAISSSMCTISEVKGEPESFVGVLESDSRNSSSVDTSRSTAFNDPISSNRTGETSYENNEVNSENASFENCNLMPLKQDVQLNSILTNELLWGHPPLFAENSGRDGGIDKPEVSSDMEKFTCISTFTDLELKPYVNVDNNLDDYSQFTCSICYYKNRDKAKYLRHMYQHLSHRTYFCSFCDYRTILKQSCIVHLRRHTGEKPYKCALCGYSCAQKSNLDSHMRSHIQSHGNIMSIIGNVKP